MGDRISCKNSIRSEDYMHKQDLLNEIFILLILSSDGWKILIFWGFFKNSHDVYENELYLCSFEPYQIITFLSLLIAENFHQSLFEVFIDGASRGNPGLAGVGVVLYSGNRRILSYREFIGEKTNNQAEYHSLKRGLQIAILICTQINVLSDSNLLVNQRLKKYKIRNMNLKSLSREVTNLENSFQHVKYKYISRQENMHADREANNAIDDYIKYQKSHSLLGSSDDSELDQYKVFENEEKALD